MDNKNPEVVFKELLDADRDERVNRARELYMAYWPLGDIAKAVDTKYETVKKWSSRYGWPEERRQFEADAASDAIRKRSLETVAIMTEGLSAIKKTIERYNKAEQLSIADTVALSKVLANVDKLMRLAEGKATEISESRELSARLTASNVVEVLGTRGGDPFLVEGEGEGDDE